MKDSGYQIAWKTDAGSIEGTLLKAKWHEGGCTFEVLFPKEAYSEIEAHQYFHLTAESRGPAFGGAFVPHGDIKVSLWLPTELAKALAPYGRHSEELAKYFTWLAQNRPEDSLVHEGSWYVESVVQEEEIGVKDELASLWTGYRTVHGPSGISKVPDSIEDAIVSFLRQNKWLPAVVDGNLMFPFKGDHGEWPVYIVPEQRGCRIYSVVFGVTDRSRYPMVSEFLHRANFGLPTGNFEFEYSSGAVRFKTSVDFGDDGFRSTLLGNSLRSNCVWSDRYARGLVDVANGEDPVAAIEKIERGSR